MVYGTCAASFSSQLARWDTSDARSTLSIMECDGCAQVISYLTGHYARTRALAAASATLRLYAETLEKPTEEAWNCVGAESTGGRLQCRVKTNGNASAFKRVLGAFWWAERCGLPLVLEVTNGRNHVLRQQLVVLMPRVVELCIHLRLRSMCAEDAKPQCDGSCGTLLCALPSFTRVSRLVLTCRAYAEVASLSYKVTAALGAAARMLIPEVAVTNVPFDPSFSQGQPLQLVKPAMSCAVAASTREKLSWAHLRELKVLRCPRLTGLADFADASWLRVLSLRECKLSSLAGMHSFSRLAELDVYGNTLLTSVDGLEGSSFLTKLTAARCSLTSLRGLSGCIELMHLDVSDNRNLTSLDGIESASALAELHAGLCDLRSLKELSACSEMVELCVQYNANLQDAAESVKLTNLRKLDMQGVQLQGTRLLYSIPNVVVLNVGYCELPNLDFVKHCGRLEELVVSGNDDLQSLRGLEDARSLRRLEAAECALSSLEGLRGCTGLAELIIDGNHELTSFVSLESPLSVVLLDASVCGLEDLRGIAHLPMLRDLTVSGNEQLRGVAEVAGMQHLERVAADSCDLRSLNGLGSCPLLTDLSVEENQYLTSLSGLSGSRSLQFFKANLCDIRDVGSLSCCLQLRTLELRSNSHLTNVASLAALPYLQSVDLSNCENVRADMLKFDERRVAVWR